MGLIDDDNSLNIPVRIDRHVYSFEEAKKYKDSHKNHDLITSHLYYVLDSVSEVAAFKNDVERRKALAKLTDAEIKLLGLTR